MAEIQKQEWSKERIQAEMKGLMVDCWVRYILAAVLGVNGVGCLIGVVPVIVVPAIAPVPVPMGLVAPFIIVVGIVGIVLVLGSTLLLRSGLAKRRLYNDLKRKL